jgi:ABC-2 type transport system permease protein
MADSLRVLWAMMRFQLWHTRRKPDDAQALVLAPLFTVIFLAIVGEAGRDDLLGHAVLAPALITVIGMSLLVAGEIIDEDRHLGVLEATVAAPVPLASVVVGRVLGVTLLGLVGFAESWLAAWLVFGVVVHVAHPLLFAATVLATAVGMAATSVFMAALFVLARSARTFQNSLSYPLYVLGGVMVPVALLPDWILPLARMVYLSWAADLLRDALTPDAVEHAAARLGVILVLSALAFAAGRLLLGRILDRVRRTGAIAHA